MHQDKVTSTSSFLPGQKQQQESLPAVQLPPASPLLSALFVFALLIPTIVLIIYNANQINQIQRVMFAAILSALGFIATNYFIPVVKELFEKRGIFGYDINKRGAPQGNVKIPEALGLVPATIYITCLCILHIDSESGGEATVLYTSALASVTFMILLGFSDDVLDLRWRYKLVLPLIGSLPLLVNYTGSTYIIIPKPLKNLLFHGESLLHLGYMYHFYMALLSIFCTNAINIYAGINGLEAGQSLVIACFILIHNAFQLVDQNPKDNLNIFRENQLFSIDLILPFVGVTIGLLRHNWYPSSVFIGDTFCYFAGMSIAMAAILGHFSETLLLFLIPQIFNFLYSLPQLFGIVPCPRHRLPKYNTETGKLHGIPSNLNLVNLTLLITGPLSEKHLCIVLMILQVICCTLGYCIRIYALKYLL